jgi:acyl-CoA synthetase (AMP-forming)/AMP-acid ligase II
MTSTEGVSSFRELIRSGAARPEHRASVIADAYQQCAFPEIVGHVETVQRFLSAQSVRPEDCISVELTNSVPSALTVLALLDGAYTFLPMPVDGLGSRAPATEVAMPRFSRWLLTAADGHRAVADLSNPASYLKLRRNPDYRDKASGREPGRLYSRTSGSLGTAKLAARSHASLAANVQRVAERMDVDPSFRIAAPTPIFHLYGLGVAFLPALLTGASVDLQDRANLLRFLEREQDFDPNVAFVTPTFCEALLRARKSPRAYRFVIIGGDRTSDFARARSEAMHGPLCNAYGSTEMGLVSMAERAMPADIRSGTVGRPLPGIEFRFSETGDVDGAGGQSGQELQLRNPYGFDGYVDLNGDPLQVPETFDGEWYRTRDLALPGPDGTLRVLGRCDLSVNRNGMLLPFADVESRLRAIEGVEEAAVSVGRDGIRGRELIAFCVVSPRAQSSSQEIRARYAASAPAFSVPDSVCIVKVLPKLANGKLDRRSITAMAESAGIAAVRSAPVHREG